MGAHQMKLTITICERFKPQYFGLLGVLTGLMLVAACSRPLSPEESCNFVQNSQYQRISWKSDKVALHIDSSVPQEFLPSVEAAVEVWNKKLNKKIISIVKSSTSGSNANASKDGVSKLYWKDSWDLSKPNEQARTTVYWQGSRIYEADVQVNAKNFKYFKTGDQVDISKVHVESLLVHEIGHVLGLAHRDDDGSVMKTNLLSGYVRDEPGQVDMSSLKCEY
jgi:hypothetical protein